MCELRLGRDEPKALLGGGSKQPEGLGKRRQGCKRAGRCLRVLEHCSARLGSSLQGVQCTRCAERWGLLGSNKLQPKGGGLCKGRCFAADLHAIISANGGLPVADYTGGYLLAKRCAVLIFPFCLFRL